MPAPHLDKERIALCRPDRQNMPDRPDGDSNQPEAQAKAHGPGKRPVHDGDGAWRTAEQDMLGQRPVDWDRKSRHHVELFESGGHQIKAPPPKLKNDKKKLDAANAIDRPNTIWITRPARNEVEEGRGNRPGRASAIPCTAPGGSAPKLTPWRES